MVENRKFKKMLSIRLDQAGKQTSINFRKFAQETGITLEYSPAYGSQSNGWSERLFQDLWKMARTFPFESRLDLNL